MKNNGYYDGTKLLSLKDINGKKPELYICTTNRTGGKTTFFSRLLLNRYFDKGEKFATLYRYNYEIDNVADKFFKDVGNLFFKGHEMSEKKMEQGAYSELYMDGKSCGYAIALNASEKIKKCSHLLSDVKRMMFDEFQSETNNYCSDEITKFLSIHKSIARGNFEQCRYLPVYMLGNPVTLLNPYYTELGISSRLSDDTKFLKGDGFVLEQGFNEQASEAQKESGISRAFAGNKYVAYSSQNVYLNDNKTFIEKPVGKSAYLCTLKSAGCHYAIRTYADLGILYCDDRADMSFPVKLTVSTDDMDVNYVMMRQNVVLINNLRFYFEHGCFRFKDLKCKNVILKTISY